MFITTKLESSSSPFEGYFRVFLFALSIGLVGRLTYGGLLYLVLKRLDLLSLPIILLAYLAPVLLFSWHASDTTNAILGTIPWVVFALIVGFVSWLFATNTGIGAS
jgi:hypothetical protein